ncbi:hypothetical protein [Hymenobacter terrenus]|uniref:hypothetical protein n=1 Tax=Hymenobacter terrenus TaxID=1629124 RepID=UPI0006191CD2|nr:hypothetical protein [Hymenobacter terrenus]
MSLFISPSQEPNWRINEEAFQAALLSRWDGAVTEKINDSNISFSLEWTIKQNQDFLTGSMNSDGNTIVIEFSTLTLGAEFALWAYSQFPVKDGIVLYNDDYSNSLDVTEQTVMEEVINEFA